MLSSFSITDKVINKQVYVPVWCGISIVLEAFALHRKGPVEDRLLLSFMCFVWMNRQLRSRKVSAPTVYRKVIESSPEVSDRIRGNSFKLEDNRF